MTQIFSDLLFNFLAFHDCPNQTSITSVRKGLCVFVEKISASTQKIGAGTKLR